MAHRRLAHRLSEALFAATTRGGFVVPAFLRSRSTWRTTRPDFVWQAALVGQEKPYPRNVGAGKQRDERRLRSKNRDQHPLDPFLDYALPSAAVVLAAALPIVFEATPAEWPDKFADPWVYVFVAAAIGTVVLTIVQGVLAQRRRSATQAGLSHFSHALGDTVAAVRTLVESEGTHADRQRFLEAMASEAKSLVPLETPRICVYVLEAPDEEDSHDYLKYVTHKGRTDPPRTEFLPDQAHGSAAIAVAKGNTHRCIDDWRKSDSTLSPIDRDPDALWRSFIIMPIRASGNPWGALMIDTIRLTRFTNDQIAICQAVARFIELGLERVEEASDDTGPEVAAARAGFSPERGEPRHVGGRDDDMISDLGEDFVDGNRA